MSLKRYFSYIRVSTQRQGNSGTSLAEQQAAIERYAQRFNLPIIKQYEERETAAKIGRPVFLQMLKDLKRHTADGLIVHKIDRSARNLKDWADLGSLIDQGIEVHFANESLDLTSRGGRLSADIQAVVAADYVRNLREEAKKGIYGRLKQGLYPFPAPVGYLNAGKGKPKQIDSIQAPLIKQAFELYASGNHSLFEVVDRLHKMGLRNKNGNKLSRSGLVGILKNPFYIGLTSIHTTGDVYVGIHKPIISKKLFDEVQAVFAGKRVARKCKHFFTYRRIMTCQRCGHLLIAETQKHHVYYRCQARMCPQKSIREELIEDKLRRIYERLQLSKAEYRFLKQEAINYQKDQPNQIESQKKLLLLQLSQSEARLGRFADAYVDEVFDSETYRIKKKELLLNQASIKEKLRFLDRDQSETLKEVEGFLELLKNAYLSYNFATPSEKREMVQITVSNFCVEGKTLLIKLKEPFQSVLNRPSVLDGGPRRTDTRTLSALFSQVFEYFCNARETHQTEDSDSLDPTSATLT